jgi:hypothetical protein
MKTCKLPNALTIAIGEYYVRRAEADERVISRSFCAGEETKTFSQRKDWDKKGLLNKITATLPKGWGYQACAGTFWFNREGCRNTYKVNETTWPKAEIIPPTKL